MKLLVVLEVEDKLEAYDVVTKLSFDHEVKRAEFNGKKEIFNENNRPTQFMKDNKNDISEVRDVREERLILKK